MTQSRIPVLLCPYCGEDDLRPYPDPKDAWECRRCTRVFTVRFVGLLAPKAG